MKIINDGKWNVFTLKVLYKKIEMDLWITRDCSASLSDYCRLIIRVWSPDNRLPSKNYARLLYIKEYNLFQLKYKLSRVP